MDSKSTPSLPPTLPAARTVAEVGEFGLIDIIRQRIGAPGHRVVLGIGDDTAALVTSGDKLLLATCDVQVEGRHFRRQRITAHQLGCRSAAINLSDIAAMGGTPLFALVSLILPKDTELAWIDEFYDGLKGELARHGAEVIGGNLSGATGGVIIDITLLGEVPPDEMLRRGGARVGDAIVVTGTFGASAAGQLTLEKGLPQADPEVAEAVRAHLLPTPRVAEGRALATSRKASAMIDVSDGLAADLGHICEESHVGARVWTERIPVSLAARLVAERIGVDPTALALHGGEDYELVFTCPPVFAPELVEAIHRATGTPATRVGEIVGESQGMALVGADGRETRLEPKGWDHFVKQSFMPRLHRGTTKDENAPRPKSLPP